MSLIYAHDGAPAGNRLGDAEMAREPRSLALLAWYDGWNRAASPGGHVQDYPRRLTRHEAAWWREGWAEAHRDLGGANT